MYINIITAKSIHNCETKTICIDSEFALTIPEVKETMLKNGWLVISIFNEWTDLNL
jgi:hypothetical protein